MRRIIAVEHNKRGRGRLPFKRHCETSDLSQSERLPFKRHRETSDLCWSKQSSLLHIRTELHWHPYAVIVLMSLLW